MGALLAASSLLALALTAVGTYGLAAHEAARRIPEVGLRLALGAGRRDIVRLLLRLVLAPVLAGASIGIAISTQLGRALESLLIGLAPTDAISFALAGLLSVAAAVAASLLPASRASRTDPASALRSE